MPEQSNFSDNIDRKTVDGFGQEWSRFDQTGVTDTELEELCRRYFTLVDFSSLGPDSIAVDAGCGSGRWGSFVAKQVGTLHLADASDAALAVARKRLENASNVVFHLADLNSLPLQDSSIDFIYSLGVLHHLPDTSKAIRALAAKLKPGGLLLLYLYYDFENRPTWYKLLWTFTNFVRKRISRMPFLMRRFVCDLIALSIYFPLASLCRLLERLGISSGRVPLSYYRESSFYTMRTDALDRFGTRLEQRFSRSEIVEMLSNSDLTDIKFQDSEPYWCVVARKAPLT